MLAAPGDAGYAAAIKAGCVKLNGFRPKPLIIIEVYSQLLQN
jgi:hypothetical protein